MSGLLQRISIALLVIFLAACLVVLMMEGMAFMSSPEMVSFYKISGSVIVIFFAAAVVSSLFED